jgi:hypothetical protein
MFQFYSIFLFQLVSFAVPLYATVSEAYASTKQYQLQERPPCLKTRGRILVLGQTMRHIENMSLARWTSFVSLAVRGVRAMPTSISSYHVPLAPASWYLASCDQALLRSELREVGPATIFSTPQYLLESITCTHYRDQLTNQFYFQFLLGITAWIPRIGGRSKQLGLWSTNTYLRRSTL